MPRISSSMNTSHPNQRTPDPSALQRPISGLGFTNAQGVRVNILPLQEGGKNGSSISRLAGTPESQYSTFLQR